MTQDELQKEYLGVVKALLAHPLTDCASPDYQLTQILKYADRIIDHAMTIVSRDTLKDAVGQMIEERLGNARCTVKNDECSLDLTLSEKDTIRTALSRTRGNRRAAAEMLGISERTLYRKINEYKLEE